ncbi:hypothetical protein ACHAQJ_008636 [Trichoderma viride]
MPSSSTNAVYNDNKTNNDESQSTVNGGIQATASACVPDNLTYSIDRFTGRNCQGSADHYLRPPPGFAQTQTQTESEARMATQLRAFDAQYYSNNSSPDK